MKLVEQLHKFEHFINVVEAGSITKGCLKSFISQPQMTKIIKQLEETTGSQLVIRSSSGIQLTSTGKKFYAHAKKVINSTNVLDLELRQQQSFSDEVHIKVGTYDSIARYFFPGFLKYLDKVNPNIKVSMVTNKSDDIFSLLENNEVDVAVIVEAPETNDFDIEEIYTDHFDLYKIASKSLLNSERLIYYSGEEESLKTFLTNGPFNQTIVCDNIETVKSLTEEGVGVGLLPTKVARDGILSGSIIKANLSKDFEFQSQNHTIHFCSHHKEKHKEVSFFKKEIKRFLRVWSDA